MRKLKFLASGLIITAFAAWFFTGESVRQGSLSGEPTQLPVEESASLESGQVIYKTESSFISPVYEAEFAFDLLGLHWMEEIPEDSFMHMQIRFRDAEENWSEWEHMHEDHDTPDHDQAEHWTSVLTNDSMAFQYKVELATLNSSQTPKLLEMDFDYVSGGKASPAAGLNRMIFDRGSMVSRSRWGADESLRLTRGTIQPSDSAGLDDDEPKFEDEEVGAVLRYDEKGEDLRWPMTYPANGVQKIVVHHTASKDLSGVKDYSETVRAIYHYHAVSRGWGDIGYNYLIAPDGSIYEGRAGGDGVVAGHAAGYNTGSLGIALIGNFENEEPSSKMLSSLNELILEKADLHGIDPDGKSTFRGEYMHNIIGHRDVGATACPGEHTYDYLPEFRKNAARQLSAIQSEGGDEAYAFEQMGSHEIKVLGPDDSAGNIVQVKNLGKSTWNAKTCLAVDPEGDADDLVDLDPDRLGCVATMKQNSVAPGRTASFIFTSDSSDESGFANYEARIRFNGTKASEQAMELVYFVEPPTLAFEIVSTDAPKFLAPGEEAEVTVKLKNRGNITWERSGDYEVNLSKSGSSLLTSKRNLAKLEEKSVKPGKTGSFTFTVKAPRNAGTQKLYYVLSLEDKEAYVQTSGTLSLKVESGASTSSKDDAQITAQSDDLNFEPGEKIKQWIQIQNWSDETWTRAGNTELELKITGPSSVKVGDSFMMLPRLKPGLSTRVYFDVTAPSKAGDYELEIRPQLNGKNLTTKAYTYEFTVGDSEEKEEEVASTEEDIRIKLTPEEELKYALITSANSFTFYDGKGNAIRTFEAGKLVRVTPKGEGFRVSSGSYSKTTDDEVRFQARSNGIMQIANFEQRPGWNLKLNDNLFRGTIEVRQINDELTLINELPLEDYLLGIGEVSNSTHEEKIKTILVLARSYAHFYMTQDEKFPGMPYHLDDSPERSQKYLGYGFESRSNSVAAAVKATEDEVVTYQGKVIKTPYFSQSNGVATKSAQDVWGWTHTPYLISVPDPYCEANTFYGHGVGLSGCGADGMAKDGYEYEEIIEYYYTGAKVDSL